MNVVWAAFFVEYVISLAIASPKKRWFLTHLHELAVIAVPMFRPLRLLRLLSVVLMLHRGSIWAFRGRVGVYVVSTTLLLVGIASLAVLDAEQNAPKSNIHTIGDALWWSFTTITTVGYGDYFPVTLTGRLVAVGLMGSGVALLGTVTALLAQWFVEQVNEANKAGAAAIEEVAATAEAEIRTARRN
jgi:voltage-gated potassium channel